MDWSYIISLSSDTLNDDKKDELYNLVTWYDIEDDNIDMKKAKALLSVCQVILKYKGEQVEMLLHELEELTLKHAEEESRKRESDFDPQSRKSTSIEFENLEHKYQELKDKYKRLMKTHEKHSKELNELKKKMKNLEQENKYLQNELKTTPRDLGSESDRSETFRDRQKELMETIQNKNTQIADLLRDAEETESENVILRNKLSKVRDELAVATNEITSMTELLKEKEKLTSEYKEKMNKISEEHETLKDAKLKLERELKMEITNLNTKVEDMNVLMEKRDNEIHALKTRLKEFSVNSSISSLPRDEPDKNKIDVLKKIIAQRDDQLMNLQNQLKIATKEIEKTTDATKNIKEERDRNANKIQELEINNKEMVKQMDMIHERCQKLQDEVSHAEKTATAKEEELRELLGKMKENGQVDVVVNLNQLYELKADNRLKEKHMSSLVRALNKLEDSCDLLERENLVLREKLGIPGDEPLNIDTANSRYRKLRKEINILKSKLIKAEDANITIKTEMLKLSSSKTPKDKKETSDDDYIKGQSKALVNENEALRKGLHEILNSVNTKKSSSVNEIKSETLEELLRALDVKHISGWYHPAMRLQAELHNLQGINAELRDQLRETRVELKKFKEESDGVQTNKVSRDETDATKQESVETNIGKKDAETTSREILENIIQKLNGKVDMDREDVPGTDTSNTLAQKEAQQTEFDLLTAKIKDLEEKYEITVNQLKVLEIKSPEEQLKKIEEIVKNNILFKRKEVYLQDNIMKLQDEVERLERNVNRSDMDNISRVYELEKNNLESNLRLLKDRSDTYIEIGNFKEVEKNLTNMTIKYRELINDLKNREEEGTLQKQMLDESMQALERDKCELRKKLIDIRSRAIAENAQKYDEKLENLSKKLAELEMNEVSERQRANHMNNLYELVKEQLHKSEERFQEYSKYNEDLLKKNLILQEQLKDVGDIVSYYVDLSVYEQQKVANNKLLEEKTALLSRVTELEMESKLKKRNFEYEHSWNDSKEQELINLRHQIVDLSATSNEKMIIAQLNNEILQQKQNQNGYKKQVDDARDQLKVLEGKLEEVLSKHEVELSILKQKETALNNRLSHLQRLLSMQKIQYLGCVPLCVEEQYIYKMRLINKQKHETFVTLCQIKANENEIVINKEKLALDIELVEKEKKILKGNLKGEYGKALNWMQEKKALQINELRYKRQAEFKETQLQHLMERVKLQDDQIAKLDEELLNWHQSLDQSFTHKATTPPVPLRAEKSTSAANLVATRDVEVQSDKIVVVAREADEIASLKSSLTGVRGDLAAREQCVNQLKLKITEYETTMNLLKKQLNDKQSQIAFYERHILDLQNKKEEVHSRGPGGDNMNMAIDLPRGNEEISNLRASIQMLQEHLKSKDEKIMEYQTLLKVDRDKHSLAAATLQEELRNLQTLLRDEKQKSQSLEENAQSTKANKAAIKQYISQVHALESHASELHTKVTSLEAQLQSAREEAVRWRSLANDRLNAMEELRQSLDEQHKNELLVYKTDSEKLKDLAKDEKNNLVQLIQKQKTEFTGRVDSDILRLFKEKDDKIYDLTVKLRQAKQLNSKTKQQDETIVPAKISDSESIKEQLIKENEHLKKRLELLLNKEKNTAEEIKNLKAQMARKPSSARSDKTERSIKDQLQRKINSLENEIVELKRNLSEQISMNEAHRVQATDNFDKWKKTKHWQQTAEKLKNKLKERDNEMEKLQQTNSGYRLLIDRLERDKHNLEHRIKTIKSTCSNNTNIKEFETLKIENMKLAAELEAMKMKLEMQQHHSGGLGAAMLQEKLESQERKIAILELTAKGTTEVRAELERLQVAISNLQKSNLRLEAENLDLKLDLERSTKEIPQLHQQIQHLDSYVDVLKAENISKQPVETIPEPSNLENKRKSELERTVLALRRVVEKLQAENKRLLSGKRPLSDRASSADKLRRDYNRLKEQHSECGSKIAHLQEELAAAKNALKNVAYPKKSDDHRIVALSDELSRVREDLQSKSCLLDKVKVLLHRAAAKEKSLLQEIVELRRQKSSTINPIPEESEESSSDI